MIEVRELTKRYGLTTAVENLSFTVEPGQITGFLGPNGAGKSTAMRLIIGLDHPDSGSALINGKPYRELEHPLRNVGVLLDARSFHPGRSAYNHLLWIAQSHGIGRQRVDEVLDITGLTGVAHKSSGTYSLGMAQRLGLAAALIGDPPILLLDEPMNGLDAEGMSWMRHLLPALASEGRAVFVSSHLMSEMAQLADRLIVIGRGRLVADTTVAQFVAQAGGSRIRVRTADSDRLAAILEDRATTVQRDGSDGSIIVTGLKLNEVGSLAADNGVVVFELSEEHPSLEAAFLQLTKDDVQYAERVS
jgi:ABC-2 type transport system ATP-binding protein